MTDIEIPIEDIEYDVEQNRILIQYAGVRLSIFPVDLRKSYLESLNEEDKVKELAMMHHEINKEVLTRIGDFIKRMAEIEDDMADALDELKKCSTAVCVKKWDAVLAASVKRKNVLKEIRLSIGLLEKQKKPLRTRIAKLEYDPSELTGETE